MRRISVDAGSAARVPISAACCAVVVPHGRRANAANVVSARDKWHPPALWRFTPKLDYGPSSCPRMPLANARSFTIWSLLNCTPRSPTLSPAIVQAARSAKVASGSS